MDHFRFSHPTCAETRLRGGESTVEGEPLHRVLPYLATFPLLLSAPQPQCLLPCSARECRPLRTSFPPRATEGHSERVRGKESWESRKSHLLSDLSLLLCLSFSDCNKR